MLMGRFLVIIPALAIAGSLVAKKTVPASAGTFPTDGTLFVGLLVGTILIVGGLTFFPALAVGPIVEHLAARSRTGVLTAMFPLIHQGDSHNGHRSDGERKTPKPFPATSTFFAIAAVFIMVWLLASALPHFLGTTGEPVSRSNIEAGASK